VSLAAGLMFALFFIAASIGVPIGYSMIASGFVYLFLIGGDIGLVAAQGLNGLFKSFVLLAVPLFVFAAEVMSAGAVSERLLRFVIMIVGRVRGGFAYVNVVVNIIFAGMSGSALADAAGPGKLMIDMMTRENRYPRGFAGALTAAASTIGPIIPPSIPMVLYGMVSGTSIGYLFIGGVLPGLLMGAALSVQIFFAARRRRFPTEPAPPRSTIVPTTVGAAPALLLPVILLGGIYSGAVTPTEAAAVAAFYALFLAIVVYRSLGLKGLIGTFVASSKSTAIVAITIIGALFFNYVVAAEQLPVALGEWITAQQFDPTVYLLMVTALFLVLGCFLDTLLMLLILVPILMPSVHALGIDPVHFGVVVIVNMMIGLITPPYGELLFLVSGITKIPLAELIREIWPFIIVLVIALLLMVLIPDIVLWLPRQAGYAG
jgi:tripartite ATP-independent transporter DctM subunit